MQSNHIQIEGYKVDSVWRAGRPYAGVQNEFWYRQFKDAWQDAREGSGDRWISVTGGIVSHSNAYDPSADGVYRVTVKGHITCYVRS